MPLRDPSKYNSELRKAAFSPVTMRNSFTSRIAKSVIRTGFHAVELPSKIRSSARTSLRKRLIKIGRRM